MRRNPETLKRTLVKRKTPSQSKHLENERQQCLDDTVVDVFGCAANNAKIEIQDRLIASGKFRARLYAGAVMALC